MASDRMLLKTLRSPTVSLCSASWNAANHPLTSGSLSASARNTPTRPIRSPCACAVSGHAAAPVNQRDELAPPHFMRMHRTQITGSMSGWVYTQRRAQQPAALRHFDLADDRLGSGSAVSDLSSARPLRLSEQSLTTRLIGSRDC